MSDVKIPPPSEADMQIALAERYGRLRGWLHSESEMAIIRRCHAAEIDRDAYRKLLTDAVKTLREASAWMPGRATPDFRGAKCDTLEEAKWMVADTLARITATLEAAK